jgi:adenine deaminase
LDTVRIRPIEIEDFKLKIEGDKARVIGLVPGQILTKSLVRKVNKDAQGHVLSDVKQDILKIAVIERHKATGNIGIGLITGLGLKEGAMASSVAHDSHNIVVAGENDLDMLVAVKEIERLHGGFVVANRGKVAASLPLPIAGLISTESAEEVSGALNGVIGAAKSQGVSLENPFFALSFLTLPVIPEIKITDKGLIDVGQFRVVPLGIS